MKLIIQIKDYRIIEIQDSHIDLELLKGDCFNAQVNNDIDPELLKAQESKFEQDIYEKGLFGYELQKWEPKIDGGWEHIDSCWGFVGTYEDENHYIVQEFKDQIPGGQK